MAFWTNRLNKGKENMKNFLSSKRFWAGLIGLLTSASLVFTGEKSFADQLPFIATGIMSLIQTVIALTSTDKVVLGFKK